MRLHRGTVLITAALITVPVLILALYVGSDFMPKLDEGAFLIQTVLPPEASLDEVDRVNHRVEDALRTFPEVEDVVRRTGRAERSEDPMPHTWSDILVILKSGGGRTSDELEVTMRKKLQTVAGVTALFTTPLGMRIDEGLGGTPADISVRIFGPDLDKLAALGERAHELIRGIRGIEDLRVEKLTGMPQLKVSIDRQAAARVGLTPGDAIRAIRVGMAGEEESEVWIGQRRFDLIVRLQDEHRISEIDRRTLDRWPLTARAYRSANWRQLSRPWSWNHLAGGWKPAHCRRGGRARQGSRQHCSRN